MAFFCIFRLTSKVAKKQNKNSQKRSLIRSFVFLCHEQVSCSKLKTIVSSHQSVTKNKDNKRYLVRDINSPIYFHQSRNIFIAKFGVMIISIML